MTEENAREIGLKYLLMKLPTQTPYGKEVKENMNPYLPNNIQDLRKALRDLRIFLQQVQKDYLLLRGIKNHLGDFKDIRGSFYRAQEGEVLTEVEFFEIKKQLMTMEKLRKFLLSYAIDIEDFYLLSMEEVVKILDPEDTGVATFYIYDDYSKELKDLRKKKREMEEVIFSINRKNKEKIFTETGVKPKINGEIVVLKEKEEQLKKLLDCENVYQTAESFSQVIFKMKPTTELMKLQEEMDHLKLLEEEEEFRIRQMLSKIIGDNAKAILKNIEHIGKIDFVMGKAILALQMKAVEPEIVEEPYLHFQEGRHVIVEEKLNSQGIKYMPVDITLQKGVTLITGANMGGKTITLKMIALLTAMAQLGLYVPAKKAIVGPVSFIYYSSGDQQSEEKGLSTFGAEIEGLKHIIDRAEEEGLILIDELARGTNPLEGYSISKGVLEYLKNKPSISVVTTHFDGLNRIKGIKHLQVVGLKNLSVESLKEELQNTRGYKGVLEKFMDYRLEEMKEEVNGPKDAIMIAKLMGLKDEIIEEAQKSLKEREGQYCE